MEQEEAGELQLGDQGELLVAAAPAPLAVAGAGVALGEGPLADGRGAGRRASRSRRRSPGSGSRAPAVRSNVRPAASSAVRRTASRSSGKRSSIASGGSEHGLVVAAPLRLAAVERGAAADRDERVLERGAARVVGVDVAGRDGRRRRGRGRARAARRAGGRRRARTAAGARRRSGRGRTPARRGAAAFGLVTPSPWRAQPERQTRPSFRSSSDSSGSAGGSGSVPGLRPRARVRLGQQPAEVRVALRRLDEQRHVAPPSSVTSAPVIGRTPNAFAACANSSEP